MCAFRFRWLALALLAAAALPSQAADRQFLRHRATPAARLRPLDRLTPTHDLRITLCLPLRDGPGLTNLLQQLQDPSSPQYRHYLTPEQFAARFGPTASDYAEAMRFARRHGLEIVSTYGSRSMLGLRGTAARMEQAFDVRLGVYRHPTQNRLFHAPDCTPSADLSIPLQSVIGLDDYAPPHPASLRAKPAPLAGAVPLTGSGPGGNLMGSDFRNAYAPGVMLTGAGQTVALVQFDGYYASDIATYAAQAGITPVPLRNVLLDGFSGRPGANNVEVAMDIEMAMSMAPGLSQIAVYEGSGWTPAEEILLRIASDNGARQISCSWTWGSDSSADGVLQQFAAQGQSFFTASGDDCAYFGAIDNPADNPYVTSVGGTTLTTGSGAARISETVWNWNNGTGSGGGISTSYSIPPWQRGVGMTRNGGSTYMRNIPDVAMAADDIWVIYGNGRSGAYGGTSAAAPLWAGFAALANQQAASLGRSAIGFANPALYSIGGGVNGPRAFHDIATGDNGGFSAVTGYDLCTGWGTPGGQALIDLLTGGRSKMAILNVSSDFGSPLPGSVTVLYGTTVEEQMPDSTITDGSTRHTCTGAEVLGNGFMATSPASVTLTLTNSAVLTWKWATQYLLSAMPSGGGTVSGGGWYAAGTQALLVAQTGTRSHFLGWTGDTNGCLISGLSLTAPMNRGRTVFALFASGALPVVSGWVKRPGTTIGLSNVVMSFSSDASPAITDATGYYAATLPYGWTGTVTPSFPGEGGFSPSARSYRGLIANATSANFAWIPPPVITGRVTRAGSTVGMSNVVIRFTGVGAAATDAKGYYAIHVPYGWSGTSTPVTAGTYAPLQRTYSRVVQTQSGQNYSWKTAVATPLSTPANGLATGSLAAAHPPTTLAHSFGSVCWPASEARALHAASDWLTVTVPDGVPLVETPPRPTRVDASVVTEPPLFARLAPPYVPLLRIRNAGGGTARPDTLLPGGRVQGSAALLEDLSGLTLTWDLTLFDQ